MPRVQRRIEQARRGQNRVVPPAAQEVNVTEGISAGDGTPAIVGCPVFDPIDCQCPKTPIDEEGVKMTCTSEPCPFAKVPLHNECYQMLEDNLVKRLATLGSARGWTVPQRRNNLWEKKGQALIGRFCRCRCGHGQMTRDKQALYEKEKAVEKEKKKKAKKTKQLPQLQFNSKHSAAVEEKKRDQRDGSVSNGRTYSTTSRSRLLTDRSSSSTCRTIAFFDTMSQTSTVERGQSSSQHQFVYAPSDSDDTDDDLFYTEPLMVPAPLPPPQRKSYAATIKKEQQPPQQTLLKSPDSGILELEQLELHELGDFVETSTSPSESLNPLGLSILSPVESSTMPEDVFFSSVGLTSTPHLPKDLTSSKISQRSPRLPLASSSSLSASSSNASSRLSSTNSPVATLRSIGTIEPRWAISSTESRSSLSSGILFNSMDRDMLDTSITCGQEMMCYSEDNVEEDWTPMFGRGFNLGERILYLP